MKNRVSGIWWLSDKPDNKIAGDLLVEDRKLELTGTFEGLKSGVYDGSPKLVKTVQQTTIQGVARNGGNKYTLSILLILLVLLCTATKLIRIALAISL